MTDLGAVFELRRAIERGEPTYRVGMCTLTMGQVERAIAEGRYPGQAEDMKRWLAGEQAAWQARLISDAAEAIEVIGEDELERAAAQARRPKATPCDYPGCGDAATKDRDNGAHGVDRYCDAHDGCACGRFMVKVGEVFTGDPDDLADTTEGEHAIERCAIHEEVIYRSDVARELQALSRAVEAAREKIEGEPDAAEVVQGIDRLTETINGALRRAGGERAV